MIEVVMAHCSQCKETKPEGEFYRQSGTAVQIAEQCDAWIGSLQRVAP